MTARLPALTGKALVYALLFLFGWVPFPPGLGRGGPPAETPDQLVVRLYAEHGCTTDQAGPTAARPSVLVKHPRSGVVELILWRPDSTPADAEWRTDQVSAFVDQGSAVYGWCRS